MELSYKKRTRTLIHAFHRVEGSRRVRAAHRIVIWLAAVFAPRLGESEQVGREMAEKIARMRLEIQALNRNIWIR